MTDPYAEAQELSALLERAAAELCAVLDRVASLTHAGDRDELRAAAGDAAAAAHGIQAVLDRMENPDPPPDSRPCC